MLPSLSQLVTLKPYQYTNILVNNNEKHERKKEKLTNGPNDASGIVWAIFVLVVFLGDMALKAGATA